MASRRRSFEKLCVRAGLGDHWTICELRHSFVSLVGHIDSRTTQGNRHSVRMRSSRGASFRRRTLPAWLAAVACW